MASSGFCTTCSKIVHFSKTDGAHCPVCSSPLVATEPEGEAEAS